jgi:hypothetical protein
VGINLKALHPFSNEGLWVRKQIKVSNSVQGLQKKRSVGIPIPTTTSAGLAYSIDHQGFPGIHFVSLNLK